VPTEEKRGGGGGRGPKEWVGCPEAPRVFAFPPEPPKLRATAAKSAAWKPGQPSSSEAAAAAASKKAAKGSEDKGAGAWWKGDDTAGDDSLGWAASKRGKYGRGGW
jgi:hypothetical protein